MLKHRIGAAVILAAGVLIGLFVYSTEVEGDRFAFKLGLDLNGGTSLTYQADTATVAPGDIRDSMTALRDVIERRVNLFGVSEPLVQTERVGGLTGEPLDRLIVELPGVSDVDQAIAMIGQTPLLDFRLVKAGVELLSQEEREKLTPDEFFVPTGLTGRLLERSALEFDPTTGEPSVSLQFNSEGEELFAKITRENVGRTLAVFLDGDLKSAPSIREEISGGKAVISGGFSGGEGIREARDLVNNLNLGALPVPIELVSTQTIGATLGEEAVTASAHAGIIAFAVVSIFLILWYRVPGIFAVIALMLYVVLNLALFKLIPVTLTAAGIAGFILSIGMAVDANILIFERMKEELKRGKSLADSVHEGFRRAWLSIRDSNISSIITGVILYAFSSTAMIKGFALVFVIGVLTSMFTAITASRTFLYAIRHDKDSKVMRFLFSNGLAK
jgi:preprotein translocase subunit SecD